MKEKSLPNNEVAEKPFPFLSLQCLILAVSAMITAGFPALQNVFERSMGMVIGLAVAATLWILLALLLGPIHVLTLDKLPTARWKAVRRSLGQWTAILLTIHLYLLWDLKYGFSLEKATAHGWASAIALHVAVIYVILMGLLSNEYSVKLLGYRLWKNYHRGIYVLFPIIAAEGAVQLNRIESPLIFTIVIGSTGVIVPILQWKA